METLKVIKFLRKNAEKTVNVKSQQLLREENYAYNERANVKSMMLYRHTLSQQHSVASLPSTYSLPPRSCASSDRGDVADSFEKPRPTNYLPKIRLPKLPKGKQFGSIQKFKAAESDHPQALKNLRLFSDIDVVQVSKGLERPVVRVKRGIGEAKKVISEEQQEKIAMREELKKRLAPPSLIDKEAAEIEEQKQQQVLVERVLDRYQGVKLSLGEA
jgi:hypothetical protein